jgi:apolipoprotein N-acyltransferase
VTFLVLHVNEALAHLIAGGFRTKILSIAVLPVILIGASGLYGAISLARGLPETSIEVTVVQWDQATNVEWTETFSRRAIDGYSELVIDELVPDPQAPLTEEYRETQRLVIWPETSVPDAVLNLNTMSRIQGLAESLDATFMVGCMTWDPAQNIEFDPESLFQPRERRIRYNSVVAFDPDRSVTPVYSKIHPVGFGEVIPMKNLITNWFPDYPWGDEDVVQGDGFYIADTDVGRIGSVICYESFFPQIARTLARDGAEILELGSNTSWFGKTPASYQHARFDVFRAVENRIWFCRAATTGVSSVIDPQGRTVAETRMFEADALTASIGLREETTLYTRWGDWLPALCGVWFMFLMLGVFVIRED